MSIKQASECKIKLDRVYGKALKEKAYSKIEEIIEKQRKIKERLLNYYAMR
jgi:hypothetical protein